MAKKKTKRSTKVSKGTHNSMNKQLTKAIRRDRSPADIVDNKLAAWRSGKNPWVTIANPVREQTNKRFIRVRANDLWGSSKGRS